MKKVVKTPAATYDVYYDDKLLGGGTASEIEKKWGIPKIYVARYARINGIYRKHYTLRKTGNLKMISYLMDVNKRKLHESATSKENVKVIDANIRERNLFRLKSRVNVGHKVLLNGKREGVIVNTNNNFVDVVITTKKGGSYHECFLWDDVYCARGIELV